MPYAILAVLVLSVGILLAALGPRWFGLRGASGAAPSSGMESLVAQAARAGGQAMKRAELESRLKKLSGSEPPRDLNQRGAMCYKPAIPPTSAEYICPRCAGRTQHVNDRELARQVRWELAAMREKVKALAVLDARLDERSFCKKCSPGTRHPAPVLVFKLTGEPERRVEGVSLRDLTLLEELLAGGEVHKGERDVESPLKDHLPRLCELLGFGPELPACGPAGGGQEPAAR